jgi:hypothetical protein
MVEITPFSEITVTADISRPVMTMTWQDLGYTIGPKDRVLEQIRAALESGQRYDLGGVIIHATGKTLERHTIGGTK